MQKILIHHNGNDPVFISASPDMFFHVIHKHTSKSKHKSLNSAIHFATNKVISENSSGILQWQAVDVG